jgi:hypothetical protein
MMTPVSDRHDDARKEFGHGFTVIADDRAHYERKARTRRLRLADWLGRPHSLEALHGNPSARRYEPRTG